jgi:hypothetical protein
MWATAAPLPQQSFHRPLSFEANKGQAPKQVNWLAHGSGYQVRFDNDGALFILAERSVQQNAGTRRKPWLQQSNVTYKVIRMKLAGGQPWSHVSGAEPTGGVSNYVTDGNPKHSLNHIPNYSRVKVEGVYQGIDVIFYGNGEDLEYDFAIAPGADPEQIQVVFEGAEGLRVDGQSGDLVLKLPGGRELRQAKPKVYQQEGKQRVEVAGGYKLLGGQRAAFTLDSYDRSQALVIDPHLQIARSFGGSLSDEAHGIAVDAAGNSYITGSTFSADFLITDNKPIIPCKPFPPFNTCDTEDVFVTKVGSLGDIVFSTYSLVGAGNGIAVDSSGVYVTGIARPPNNDDSRVFTFQNNNGDMFVERLTFTGELFYFQLVGGPGADRGLSIALDSQHNAWIAGQTSPGTGFNDASNDYLLAKVDPNGFLLLSLTGGSDEDDGAFAITVDPADQPWVTGWTCGGGFPTTDGIFHRPNKCAVFVLQLSPSGQEKMGMIFGGTDFDDIGMAIVSNGSNTAYVAGAVDSTRTFPTTPGALLPSVDRPGDQGFIAEVTTVVTNGLAVGTIVRCGMLAGATGAARIFAIANDNRGAVYVAGQTDATSFPGSFADTQTSANRGFVTKVKFDLSQVYYSVILGQSLKGLAVQFVGPIGEIFVAGVENGGFLNDDPGHDPFMVKIIDDTPVSLATTTTPQVAGNSVTLSWGGTSPTAGISLFDVFVSDNGGPFTPFLSAVPVTSATFTGVPGHTYGFFSIATDAAGNREPTKTAPDVVVTISATPPTVLCTGGYFLKNGARATVAFNVSVGGTGSTFALNFRDATSAAQFISSTTPDITVSGTTATFSGLGKFNGQQGYGFLVTAADGGGPGSGLDTVTVTITAPDNSVVFSGTGVIAGGDIVVHQ